jgi:Uma2 family endonuclease
MALPQERLIFSPEQYLEFEREAEERSEYYDGHIVKMAGESLSHSRICVNLAGEMRTLLRGKPCEALSPNMKVRTESKRMFAYPDLTIVCGEPVFHDRQRDVLTNPRVIFEVLSPSTEKFDRGVKFMRYQSKLPSLTDYVLISQDVPFVEHYCRQQSGGWLYVSVFGVENSLRIDSIDCAVRLAEIYERVEFDQKQMSNFLDDADED